MATVTSNLGLTLPFQTEAVSVTTQNDNMNIIDGAVGGVEDALAIVANGNTHAAIASGQYVYVRNHTSLAQGLYKATAAIAANATLSTSNLTADGSGGLNDLKASVDTLNGKLTVKDIGLTVNLTANSITTGDIDISAKPALLKFVVGHEVASNTDAFVLQLYFNSTTSIHYRLRSISSVDSTCYLRVVYV